MPLEMMTLSRSIPPLLPRTVLLRLLRVLELLTTMRRDAILQSSKLHREGHWATLSDSYTVKESETAKN